MSEYIFKLPDLGEGTVESEIAEWFIAVGDQVSEEDVVGTMMTDKAAVELSSPVSGKVVRLAGEPGDIVAVGAPLVIFETDTAAAAETSPSEPAPKTAEAPRPETAPEPKPAPETAAPQLQQATPDRKRVMTSPAIRRRAKDMGVDLRLVPGSGPGGRITRTDFDQYISGNPVHTLVYFGNEWAASQSGLVDLDMGQVLSIDRLANSQRRLLSRRPRQRPPK